MERDGLLLHLYAGEKSGFTFEAAWRQSGGEEKVLLELDVKRSPQHDLLPDDGVYASLLTAALQGKVHGILGGPNCRTRSVLRHYDIPGCENPPRPGQSMEWGRIWKRRSHRGRRKDGAGGRHLALETSFPLHHRHVRKKGAWPRSSDGVRFGTAVFSEGVQA